MAVVKGHISVQEVDYNPTTRAVLEGFTCASGLLADMQSFGAAFIPLLDKVVGGLITKAQLVIPLALPGGLKGAAVPGINNSVAGLFEWLNATTVDKYGVAYPAWYTANAGNGFEALHPSLVNVTDADVVNFIAFQEATTNTCQFVTEDGFPVTGYSRAIKSGRSIRRQLARAK